MAEHREVALDKAGLTQLHTGRGLGAVHLASNVQLQDAIAHFYERAEFIGRLTY